LSQRTPLHDVHIALGAKMVPFAGFEMPVQYPAGITAEHKSVRENDDERRGGSGCWPGAVLHDSE
jgi:glycine cleavage system aminomethyltransferase T